MPEDAEAEGGIGQWDEDEDFYEDDEPLEKILAAYETGRKFLTKPPAWAPDIGEDRAEQQENAMIFRDAQLDVIADQENRA